MGNLKPRRGKGLLKVTQLVSGQAGSPESPGLYLSGAPVRVETLPGSSRSLDGGRNNPRCLVTPLKWEAWKTSGGGILKLRESCGQNSVFPKGRDPLLSACHPHQAPEKSESGGGACVPRPHAGSPRAVRLSTCRGCTGWEVSGRKMAGGLLGAGPIHPSILSSSGLPAGHHAACWADRGDHWICPEFLRLGRQMYTWKFLVNNKRSQGLGASESGAPPARAWEGFL